MTLRELKGLIVAVQDDTKNMESCIIAAIRQGSAKEGDELASCALFDASTIATKRKAVPSASIGKFSY